MSPIEALMIDAELGDDRQVALEVRNVDEEFVYLEVSTAARSELLIIERPAAIALAVALWEAAREGAFPPR